ncbi:MAG: polyamine ABC transporter substrate-binding protein, partial [Hyphomicrobiales bacterium]
MKMHAAGLAGLMLVAGLHGQALAEETVLRVSSGASNVSTLDAHRASATDDKALVGWLYNGLVRFKPGSADPKDLEPDLAERWETSPDGKVWTFHLRKGVRFHGDWGTLNADDVVYSLQRAGDPKRSTFSSDFSAIDKVEKVDDLTVRITLKYPDVNFLGRVSNYHGGNIVSRKAGEELGDRYGAKPVGTGPFTFVEQVTQQYVKLAANPDYFRGKPKIDTIMMRAIPSDSARELAFTSGELDLFYGKREQRWVDSARKRPGFNVEIFQPGEYRLLHINRSQPPLDDIRVRRAIAAAVNVDDLVRYVGKDVG